MDKRLLALLVSGLWMAANIVYIDVQLLHDAALEEARALRLQLADARAQASMYQRALKVSEEQARQLAGQIPPPCPPCPTLGERIRRVLEGRQ